MTFTDNKGRRRRIRWEILWILLAILLTSWFLSGAEVSFTFGDLMSWVKITDEDRMRRFVVLVLCLTAVVLVYRVLTTKNGDHK